MAAGNLPKHEIERPFYGIDAPNVFRGFAFLGFATLLVGYFGPRYWEALAPAHGLVWMGVTFLAAAVAMSLSSHIGKLHAADKLLDALALRGDERVLDLGCGRGLLLIGAAKRLPDGEAVGIDLWSRKDLSENNSAATLQNARLEGVHHRVAVEDGDMQKLPFADQSFDAVMAMFSIDNIPTATGRDQALSELTRVLKPGGRVALQDMSYTRAYAEGLRRRGYVEIKRKRSFLTFPPSCVVFGRKP